MPRSFVFALVAALPTAGVAQDFCAVLNATRVQVSEARTATREAFVAIDDLRIRLNEDRERYRSDVTDLALPAEDTELAENQLEAALASINELRARRCPSIPDGR